MLSDINLALKEFNFRLPVIIKPVDSAGSKGVTKVNLKQICVRNVKCNQFISKKTFIIEDYLECKGLPQIRIVFR